MKICKTCKKKRKLTDFKTNGWRNGTRRYESVCKTCTGAAQETVASVSPTVPRQTADLIREHRRDIELKALKMEHGKLIKDLHLAQKRQHILDGIATFSAPQVRFKKPISKVMRRAAPVLLCSDWHVEERVEAEKVNGLNEYDMTIAARRINKLEEGFSWLVDMHRTKFEIDTAVVWLGGDLFTGHIHEDCIEVTELAPVESVLWLQDKLVRFLDGVMATNKFERLIVPCSYGNHGRTTPKRRIATGAEHSYEWMMYQQLANWYKAHDSRVEIVAPKSKLIYLQVYDSTLRFTHGDEISYGGGIGGLTIPMNKAVIGWDKGRTADITNCGHFHSYASETNIVRNGSLIGYGPYSIEVKAGYEPPRQAYYLVDSKHGKLGDHPVWVD